MKDRRMSRWGAAAGMSLLLHGLFFLALAGLLSLWPPAPPQEPVLEIELVSRGGPGGASSVPGGGQGARLSLPPSGRTVPDGPAERQSSDSSLPVSEATDAGAAGSGTGAGNGRGTGEGSGTGGGQGNGTGPSAGEEAETVEAPQILSAHAPVYPEEARRRGQEGTAVVGLLIGEDGAVRETWLEDSAGDEALDRAALEAVRSWRFVPARQNGVPAAARSRVPVVFQLHGN